MAAVHTLPCAYVKGTAVPQTQRVQTYGITGVDGVGVHLLGLFGDPNKFTVIQYGSISGLNTWFNTLAGLKGSIVSVVNDGLQTYTNQLIESVGQPQRRTSYDLNGSVEIWTVQMTTRTV